MAKKLPFVGRFVPIGVNTIITNKSKKFNRKYAARIFYYGTARFFADTKGKRKIITPF